MWAKGFLPQLPESPEILDLLLLTIHKPRKVQRDGIRFQGLRFISPTLAGFVGELVTVRYDPRDLAEIKVYYREKFLCTAICQDIAEMVVSLKEIKAARSAVKKELSGKIKQSQLLLKTLSKAKHAKRTTIKQEEPPSPLKLYHNE